MNTFLSLILFFFLIIFYGTNAQWYIIKKDHPAMSMNYPNPGKRSISEDKLHIDCSIPYSYLTSYQEKTKWLLLCKNKQSPLISDNDSSSSSSSSNSIENVLYSSPRLIPHERRTLRSTPPYFNEQDDLFNIRLLKRLKHDRQRNN